MVRFTALLPLLPLLACPATPTPTPLDISLPLPKLDLIDWWRKNIFICPLWKGALPIGFQDLAGSICYNSQTKTYTRDAVTVRLYQVPGPWQQDGRYSEILSGAGAAIQKGLATISPLLTGSLTINIGFMSGGLGDRVQIDSDNSGTTSPCYLIVNYPAEWVSIPLVAIQKDLIQRMYQCVEQFHRPTVTEFTEANTWWRDGIARYMDGLSYPSTTTTTTTANDLLRWGLYPEEYNWGLALYQNDAASALFFHYVDQGEGWTTKDVDAWMRGHANKATYDEERMSLSTDNKITSGVWHRFVLASIDGTIRYTTTTGQPQPGPKIGPNTNGGVPRRTRAGVVRIPAVGGKWTGSLSVDSFKGIVWVFTFQAGQSFRLSVDTMDEGGVEWSIWRVGGSWNSGDRGRSVNVVVPAAGGDVKWEIALSSTAGGGGGSYPRVSVTRTA